MQVLITAVLHASNMHALVKTLANPSVVATLCIKLYLPS